MSIHKYKCCIFFHFLTDSSSHFSFSLVTPILSDQHSVGFESIQEIPSAKMMTLDENQDIHEDHTNIAHASSISVGVRPKISEILGGEITSIPVDDFKTTDSTLIASELHNVSIHTTAIHVIPVLDDIHLESTIDLSVDSHVEQLGTEVDASVSNSVTETSDVLSNADEQTIDNLVENTSRTSSIYESEVRASDVEHCEMNIVNKDVCTTYTKECDDDRWSVEEIESQIEPQEECSSMIISSSLVKEETGIVSNQAPRETYTEPHVCFPQIDDDTDVLEETIDGPEIQADILDVADELIDSEAPQSIETFVQLVDDSTEAESVDFEGVFEEGQDQIIPIAVDLSLESAIVEIPKDSNVKEQCQSMIGEEFDENINPIDSENVITENIVQFEVQDVLELSPECNIDIQKEVIVVENISDLDSVPSEDEVLPSEIAPFVTFVADSECCSINNSLHETENMIRPKLKHVTFNIPEIQEQSLSGNEVDVDDLDMNDGIDSVIIPVIKECKQQLLSKVPEIHDEPSMLTETMLVERFTVLPTCQEVVADVIQPKQCHSDEVGLLDSDATILPDNDKTIILDQMQEEQDMAIHINTTMIDNTTQINPDSMSDSYSSSMNIDVEAHVEAASVVDDSKPNTKDKYTSDVTVELNAKEDTVCNIPVHYMMGDEEITLQISDPLQDIQPNVMSEQFEDNPVALTTEIIDIKEQPNNDESVLTTTAPAQLNVLPRAVLPAMDSNAQVTTHDIHATDFAEHMADTLIGEAFLELCNTKPIDVISPPETPTTELIGDTVLCTVAHCIISEAFSEALQIIPSETVTEEPVTGTYECVSC